MTRLWVRVAVATVAIVATLAVALNTFVIEPATRESERAAATAAAIEARLVAQVIPVSYTHLTLPTKRIV